MYKTFIETTFAAAHQLRNYKGSCGQLHGHTWKVRVETEADRLDKTGMTIDFKDLKTETDSVISEFDHHYINQVAPFDRENPTAENLARYIYRKIEKILPENVKISEVTVWESDSYGVKYSEK